MLLTHIARVEERERLQWSKRLRQKQEKSYHMNTKMKRWKIIKTTKNHIDLVQADTAVASLFVADGTKFNVNGCDSFRIYVI